MPGAGAPAAPFKGVVILLGGVEYVLPPLSFGGIEQAKGLMQTIDGNTAADAIVLQAAFVDVLHIALQRNYPDMPRQVLVDALDWPLAVTLYRQLLEVSFPQPAAGEPRVESPSGALTGS
jgi:hypothetical protein